MSVERVAESSSSQFVIGLTGGIAAGKSTVLNLFRRRGASVVDTDVTARELMASSIKVHEELRHEFGQGIFTGPGEVDRSLLRKKIFTNKADRQRVNAILHPKILACVKDQALADTGPYCVIEIPLLSEIDMPDWIDRVLTVEASSETQLHRLQLRDGRGQEENLAILGAQASRGSRLKIADDVINNSGPERLLQSKVAELDKKYRQLAREKKTETPS